MTRISLILPLLLPLFAACNHAPQSAANLAGAHSQSHVPVPTHASPDIDPVCGMIRDSTWTDFSLYRDDTVWFCAAIEKKAFDANPEKYLQSSATPGRH